jgi:hypothetical protein
MSLTTITKITAKTRAATTTARTSSPCQAARRRVLSIMQHYNKKAAGRSRLHLAPRSIVSSLKARNGACTQHANALWWRLVRGATNASAFRLNHFSGACWCATLQPQRQVSVDEVCRSYGYQVGTKDFSDCQLKLAEHMLDAQGRVAAAAASVPPAPPVQTVNPFPPPQLMVPPPGIIQPVPVYQPPAQVNCTTTGVGATVYTNCRGN